MNNNTPKSIQHHWLWNDSPYPKLQGYLDLRFGIGHTSTEVLFHNCRYLLKENEIITSDAILAKRWGWSRNKVRKFLKQLEYESLIVCDRDKTRTIITVMPNNLPLSNITHEASASPKVAVPRSPDREHLNSIQENRLGNVEVQEKVHLNTLPTKGLSNVEVLEKEREKVHQKKQAESDEGLLKNLFSGTADAKSVGNPDPNNTSPDIFPMFESNARVVGPEALEKNYKITFPNENK